MKKHIFFLLLAIYLAINASAEMQCAKIDLSQGSCQDTGSVLVLRVSDYENAHAELPDQTNYGFGICCKADKYTLTESDPGILDYACIPEDYPNYYYTALSGETNAHAEFPTEPDNTFDSQNNVYTNELCMNASGEIKCKALPASADPTGEGFIASECVLGLTSKLNAHVYTCDQTPNEEGFFKVYCTDESRITGDVLELKIRTLNEDGIETGTFYTNGTIYLELNLKNFTNSDITGVIVNYAVKDTTISGSSEPLIIPVEGLQTIIPITVPDNIQPDSYILEATTIYEDDPVKENNSDKAYITILVGGEGVTIPETSPVLIVLIAFGVLFIIGGMPGKSLN